MVFWNRVLRETIEPKEEKATVDWRKVRNTSFVFIFFAKYYWYQKTKESACSTHVRDEIYIESSSHKTRMKETSRTLKRRWMGNFKVDLKETGYEIIDLFHVAQIRDK